uniref:Uncharacterized protein n=1 Tax=Romanomermis culicivorax TaxID=13658 RepID=A0A915IQ41_ROMCU
MINVHQYMSKRSTIVKQQFSSDFRKKPKIDFFKKPKKTEKNFVTIIPIVIVGHFLENCSYTFQSKVDFQAERYKLLAISSIPFCRKRQFTV